MKKKIAFYIKKIFSGCIIQQHFHVIFNQIAMKQARRVHALTGNVTYSQCETKTVYTSDCIILLVHSMNHKFDQTPGSHCSFFVSHFVPLKKIYSLHCIQQNLNLIISICFLTCRSFIEVRNLHKITDLSAGC